MELSVKNKEMLEKNDWEPVRRGKWVFSEKDDDNYSYRVTAKCSECG